MAAWLRGLLHTAQAVEIAAGGRGMPLQRCVRTTVASRASIRDRNATSSAAVSARSAGLNAPEVLPDLVQHLMGASARTNAAGCDAATPVWVSGQGRSAASPHPRPRDGTDSSAPRFPRALVHNDIAVIATPQTHRKCLRCKPTLVSPRRRQRALRVSGG